MSSEGPEAARWRRAIYGRGAPRRTDLIGLMTLAAASDDFDVLALIADVARDALLPERHLACVDADWLMEVCGDGHGLNARSQFEALTSVLRHAVCPPAELVAFAAREIERAILTGERGFIGGRDGEPGRVMAGDVEALQEIRRTARPDRALAEVLFDIAHATATADNDPGFDALFCETLRAYLGAEAPAGMRFDEFLATLAESPAPDTPCSDALDGMADAGYREAAEATSARCEAAARLPAPAARWAVTHLSRGALSSAERQLVAALRDPAAAMTLRAA